ncbi:hypothetical protein QVD17_40774 [Tagetes erecta]|uniref:Uncharacterized protein n=1 Tax=Tagetes erecta TaxID=13708 RepID=A0AAD8JSG6_TARER|nr:hypothetical protein QVD17_40774 [Tagetes erecta]
MKASIKLRDEQKPLFRAKIPLNILGLPFQSGIVAGESKELSLNLATYFESAPLMVDLFDNGNKFKFSDSPFAGVFSDAELTATTAVPLRKNATLNFRWGFKLPATVLMKKSMNKSTAAISIQKLPVLLINMPENMGGKEREMEHFYRFLHCVTDGDLAEYLNPNEQVVVDKLVQIRMILHVVSEEVVGPGRVEMVLNVSSGIAMFYVASVKTLDVTELRSDINDNGQVLFPANITENKSYWYFGCKNKRN